MAKQAATPDCHAQHHAQFQWHVPAQFNIAQACCGRWARQRPHAVAIRYEHEGGARSRLTYGQLQAQANRLSHVLRNLGVVRGDRVAIVMPQRLETAVAHMAVYQLGAVAMPLSMLFGPEALHYRLLHSEAVIAIADETSLAKVLEARRAGTPALRCVIGAGAAQGPGEAQGTEEAQADQGWNAAMAAVSSTFSPEPTLADDAAVLIYTSGTTGPPKGALIPHRALIGNLSGFVCSQNGFPLMAQGKGRTRRPVFWSPADWAWTGGLMDALLPTLYFGCEIVAFQGRFHPDKAFALMQGYGVTHSFLFPTALKAMMKAVPQPRKSYRLRLQAVMSAGEAVGDAVFEWCLRELGLTVNEMFGQTEINYIVGNCTRLFDAAGHAMGGWPAKPGSMGRPYPGHKVAVIDDTGQECPRGTVGDVAVHRLDVHSQPDPVFFLGYWKNDPATAAKFTGAASGSWCRTGDMASMDADGWLWYQGRSDDMFKAAGYRIGPSEIENCLIKHPKVANAAVVPKPDPERGAVIKAYIVLPEGESPGASLVAELQTHVRERLASYEVPKEIEFVDALPMTTTGKVQRRFLREREAERVRDSADS